MALEGREQHVEALRICDDLPGQERMVQVLKR